MFRLTTFCLVATCYASSVVHGARFLPLGTGGGGGPPGSSWVSDISADGTIVVGESLFPSGESGFRWTEATGMLPLAGNPPGDFLAKTATGISGDGSLIYGHFSLNGSQAGPYIWTQSGGFQAVALEPTSVSYDGTVFVVAPDRDISADGTVVVGYELHSIFGIEAYRDSPSGREWLGELPGGEYGSVVLAVSPEGSAIVGQSKTVFDNMGIDQETERATRWTNAEGMVALGPWIGAVAWDVSNHGLVVVGHGNPALGFEPEPFRWTPATGMVSIRELLLDRGIDVAAMGWTLGNSVAISADGQTIVGAGISPISNDAEAWLVELSIPGDFDHDGDTDGANFLRWQIGNGITEGATEEDGDARHKHLIALRFARYPVPIWRRWARRSSSDARSR